MLNFTCSKCHIEKPVNTSGGTGYGTNKQEEKICYECCGKEDLTETLRTGFFLGYLTEETDYPIISNWPGTLRIRPICFKRSKTNWGHIRTDAWFRFPDDAFVWHGKQIGDNNQIFRAKRTKKTKI